ncbi:MAG TPA: c-type cytochrome [Anaerolineales bacterium]|nr:c-type cytochrome [Anaerolineales bacterium]
MRTTWQSWVVAAAFGVMSLAACNGGAPVATPYVIKPGPVTDPAGTDIAIELPAGDAARGAQIAQVRGCTACHISGAPTIGPAWESATSPEGLSTSAQAAHRIASDDYNGPAKTVEEYLFESIVSPNIDIVPPTTEALWPIAGPSTMSADYGSQLSRQDLADLLAYLLTFE